MLSEPTCWPPRHTQVEAERAVRIGLLGCGTVGAAVVRALRSGKPRTNGECYAGSTSSPKPGAAQGTGHRSAQLEVTRIAVRDPNKHRECAVVDDELSMSPVDVACGADIDVVVEALGGIEPARTSIISALSLGRPVVTANKALLGAHGPELFDLARRNHVPLLIEAAIGGAIPVVRTLGNYLAGEHVTRFEAVLNGTSNYVLSRMEDGGTDLDAALAEAREHGYAEADPSRDLDGNDAADKAAILSHLVWGFDTRNADVQRMGIEWIDTSDIVRERRRGRVWRLVSSATAAGCVQVEPRALPIDDPLARVRGSDNAVVVESDRAGTLLLSGPGAGGKPTASAIVADLRDLLACTVTRNISSRPSAPT